MRIQPLTLNDLDMVSAMQPPEWPLITPAHLYYFNHDFCFPLKIIIDDKIAGIGTTIIHPDTAWLAHIIVHPEYRNRGIGSMITKTLLDIGHEKGKETFCLLATDLGEPIYRKLGFITDTEYVFFKEGKIDPEWYTIPGIIPFHEKYERDIIAMDTSVSGENRAMRLKEHFPNAFVFLKNDNVAGYYIPGFGEGMIIANDAEAGKALMKLRLTRNPIAIFPHDNKEAIQFMLGCGAKEFRKAKRMRMGKAREWHPEHIYNRISGQVG